MIAGGDDGASDDGVVATKIVMTIMERQHGSQWHDEGGRGDMTMVVAVAMVGWWQWCK